MSSEDSQKIKNKKAHQLHAIVSNGVADWLVNYLQEVLEIYPTSLEVKNRQTNF